MAGILIYQIGHKYFSLISTDNEIYDYIKKELVKDNYCKIIWEKGNVPLEKIENARKIKEEFIEKLNLGENINLKGLESFFT